MILVAITGSICSGKSFIGQIASDLGHPLFSCDDEVHKLLKQKYVIGEIKKHFPQAVLNNKVAKKILAEIIFDNKRSREVIESILYPKLFKRESEFINKYHAKKAKIIFFEVPLLFEKNLQSKYSVIIVAHAPENILKKRAADRGIEKKLFYKILSLQIPSKKRIPRADYVIDTSLSIQQTREKIVNMIEIIKKQNAL
ncbi:MAG: dephospho-CoA kinase [Pseudomonadota bacterium]